MRTMEWAARRDHLGGIPRKMIFMAVGAFAKAVANLLNTTTVYNVETLLRLVRHRPPGVPLLTVSNHMSTSVNLSRKCIPITRGGGIYQEHMNEALERLTDGAWLHTFPEGKVCQEDAPIRRLKWGTASLIARAPITPIVLPIVHRGFEKDIRIVIGEPIAFDVPELKQKAVKMSRDLSFSHDGWPKTMCGLDEAAQRCLYTIISDQIQVVMERLRLDSSLVPHHHRRAHTTNNFLHPTLFPLPQSPLHHFSAVAFTSRSGITAVAEALPASPHLRYPPMEKFSRLQLWGKTRSF
ncbi:hypothetical protein DH2020_013703 [Rehmannia glutinosa]|uniref:Tafazzin family protein n=1 Tax=Rehmannia glutinosa TaxID=99300 RepID=A0ABR0X6A4_REHGL